MTQTKIWAAATAAALTTLPLTGSTPLYAANPTPQMDANSPHQPSSSRLPLPSSEERAAGRASTNRKDRGAGGLGAPQAPIPESASPITWSTTTHLADAGWGRMTPLFSGHAPKPAPTHWLAVCTLYPRPNSILQLRISDDGARTWKTLATVAEPGRNLDNGEVIELPDGAMLLTGRSVVDGHNPGDPQSYHFPVYRSTDGGKTWTFLSQIDTSEPGPFVAGRPSLGLWEPHFFLLPDGRLACQYANEKHAADPAIPHSQVVSEKVSPDGGSTWGREFTVASQIGGGNQRPGMPVVARLPNGSYYAIYEVVGIGNADVYGKTSPDGVTWSPGIGAPVPGQHAGPFVICLTDGRLLATSCSNRLSLSTDSGATWTEIPAPFPELGQVFSWPALYQTAPNQIAAMTTRHGINLRWGTLTPPP